MIQAMMLQKVLAFVLPKVLDSIKDVIEYARKDNELDLKVKEIESKINLLEADSHPPIFTQHSLNKIKNRLNKLEQKNGLNKKSRKGK